MLTSIDKQLRSRARISVPRGSSCHVLAQLVLPCLISVASISLLTVQYSAAATSLLITTVTVKQLVWRIY